MTLGFSESLLHFVFKLQSKEGFFMHAHSNNLLYVWSDILFFSVKVFFKAQFHRASTPKHLCKSINLKSASVCKCARITLLLPEKTSLRCFRLRMPQKMAAKKNYIWNRRMIDPVYHLPFNKSKLKPNKNWRILNIQLNAEYQTSRMYVSDMSSDVIQMLKKIDLGVTSHDYTCLKMTEDAFTWQAIILIRLIRSVFSRFFFSF